MAETSGVGNGVGGGGALAVGNGSGELVIGKIEELGETVGDVVGGGGSVGEVVGDVVGGGGSVGGIQIPVPKSQPQPIGQMQSVGSWFGET